MCKSVYKCLRLQEAAAGSQRDLYRAWYTPVIIHYSCQLMYVFYRRMESACEYVLSLVCGFPIMKQAVTNLDDFHSSIVHRYIRISHRILQAHIGFMCNVLKYANEHSIKLN